jgi:hypothetical protein
MHPNKHKQAQITSAGGVTNKWLRQEQTRVGTRASEHNHQHWGMWMWPSGMKVGQRVRGWPSATTSKKYECNQAQTRRDKGEWGWNEGRNEGVVMKASERLQRQTSGYKGMQPLARNASVAKRVQKWASRYKGKWAATAVGYTISFCFPVLPVLFPWLFPPHFLLLLM